MLKYQNVTKIAIYHMKILHNWKASNKLQVIFSVLFKDLILSTSNKQFALNDLCTNKITTKLDFISLETKDTEHHRDI